MLDSVLSAKAEDGCEEIPQSEGPKQKCTLLTSTKFKYYTGLIEKSKTHFYGPCSGLSGVLAFIEK